MSQELREAPLVLVLLDDPPPQPAIAAAQMAKTRANPMVILRVKTAPVYLGWTPGVWAADPRGRIAAILRTRSIAAVLAATGLMAGLLAQGGGASPVAHTAAFSPCDISGKQQDLGASYVTSLKVQGVSCAKGEKVIKAYHQCRHQAGGPAGTCGSTLLGFKCKDGKRTGVPNVQYNATAKCHKVSNASKRVKSRYTQNT